MKAYFAGLSDERLITNETDILLSYINDFSKIEKLKTKKKMFLDSGAFSAFTKGKEVNLDEYIKYIKENEHYFAVYALLDVINNEKDTMKNLEYMEANGLHPLPVFHFRSDLNTLEKMVKKYDYIALGGLVPLAKKRKLMRMWLDTCFSIIKNKVKVHGFGINAFSLWEEYPFYSVDATSWVKWSIFYKSNNITKESKKIKFFKRKEWTDLQRQKFLIDCYIKKAKEVTKLWESRGVSWKE